MRLRKTTKRQRKIIDSLQKALESLQKTGQEEDLARGCAHCDTLMGLWNKSEKGPREANLLARAVPEHFQEVNRYFDMDLQTMVYVMQCRHCERIFHIPH